MDWVAWCGPRASAAVGWAEMIHITKVRSREARAPRTIAAIENRGGASRWTQHCSCWRGKSGGKPEHSKMFRAGARSRGHRDDRGVTAAPPRVSSGKLRVNFYRSCATVLAGNSICGPPVCLTFRLKGDVDVVADLHEGDPFVHAVVFAVENHFAFDLTQVAFAVGNDQRQLFGLGGAADGKIAVDFDGVVAGSYEFGGVKSNRRIVLGVEEILALELAIFHAAAGIDAVGRIFMSRTPVVTSGDWEGERPVPGVKFSGDGDGSFHREFDLGCGRA